MAFQTPATLVVQSFMTFTALRWGQLPFIQFTNGPTGSAGSEVVTVTGNTISVAIESGVSTMLQISNAIAAHRATTGFNASDLVSVAITTGHNSDPVKTLKNVPLAGGNVAQFAKLTVGPLLLTAIASGTAGNSIRLRFTAGAVVGSEIVTVSGNDISVQIADGESSFGNIRDALVASGPAVALITPSSAFGTGLYSLPEFTSALLSPGDNDNTTEAFVASLPSYINLTGGAAAVASTVVVQGITITSSSLDTSKNGATFSATPGATAGAEVVTMTGNNISVQIAEGVSTVTQVVTALQAAPAFTALYTASGSGATAVRTVDPSLGGQSGLSYPGTYGFYTDQTLTTLTTTYQYLSFGNVMLDITINNDDATGTNKLSWSWDGTNVHGMLGPTQALSYDIADKSGIYVKFVNGSPAFRITASAR
jgi:hypothetical protein